MMLLGVLCAVDSTPYGAPPRACQSMSPIHGCEPRNSTCPYRFVPDRTEILSNESVILTIKATPGRKFKGFMVQARNEQDAPVGRFYLCGYNIRLTSCAGGIRDTASHYENNSKTRTNMKWRPPVNYTGTVTFYVTVVERLLSFWAKQRVSPDIKVH